MSAAGLPCSSNFISHCFHLQLPPCINIYNGLSPYLDLEECSLPLSTMAGRVRVTACAGLLCLLYGVPEGHTLSGLPLAARGRTARATWSTLDVPAKLGTLNETIPNLSDVAQESRLWGEVVSSKT